MQAHLNLRANYCDIYQQKTCLIVNSNLSLRIKLHSTETTMTMNDFFGTLSVIVALGGILFTIWQFLGPKLALSFSSIGTLTSFGTEVGYVWHLELRNRGKLRPAKNVRAVVRKISHGPANGPLKIKWTHPMQIKWSYDGDRSSSRTVRRGSCEIANIGFIIKKMGIFS